MSLGIARAVLDDAIRRSLPATKPALCELTGYSDKQITAALKRLSRFGCVVLCDADTWRRVDGVAWASDLPREPMDTGDEVDWWC